MTSTEVATTKPPRRTRAPRDQAVAPASESTTLLSVIQRASVDPACDIEKMERLLTMFERTQDRQAEAAFNAAMVRAQNQIRPVARDAVNAQTNSRYARLEAIDQAISPLYTAEGFALTFGTDTSPLPGHVRVVCDALHQDGFSKRSIVDLPLDATGIGGKINKTGVHAHGSTYSYARRYLTLMIFNVVMADEDDDGQGANTPTVKTITALQAKRLEAVLGRCGPKVNAKFAEDYGDPTSVPADRYDAVLAGLESAAAKLAEKLQSAQQGTAQ